LRIPAEGPAAVLPGQKTGAGTDSEMDIPGAPVRLEVNLASGAVAFPENYQADDRKKEILKQVGDGLTEAHLSALRRHYKEAKDWGNENNWKEADWSHLADGILVYWTEVFPLAEPWIFRHENTDYMAEDSYCIVPSCDCNDAHIAIYKIHRPPLLSRILAAMAHLSGRNSPPTNLSATIIGVVKYDTKTGQLSVGEVECGRPDQLLRLAGVLFETTKNLASELRRRYGFMRDFGRHVAEQKKLKAAPVTRPFTPGRNAPCPCGSGRKYKKCCLGRGVSRP
jgi:hypothetical protein